jgi:type I restriction enzyme, S subunit
MRRDLQRLQDILEALDSVTNMIGGYTEAGFVANQTLCYAVAHRLTVVGEAVARGINIGDVRALQIPIPSHEEQRQIIRRIETAFDRINRSSAVETARACTLLDRLEQATLAKVFRGDLAGQS